MTPNERTILAVRDLHKSYRMGSHEIQVLKGIEMELRKNEMLAVVGQSGSGKSTLLHHVGLLDRPDRGQVLFDGRPLPLAGVRAALVRNRTFGFVFQFYHLLPEFTALENVLLPAMLLPDWAEFRRQRKEVEARAADLLRRVGLAERMRHRPSQLSGGERQRVAIARALVNRPPVLLCDEPTGNLDLETAAGVKELLWGLHESTGQTMIVVTHDATLAADTDRTLELINGRLRTPA